MRPGPQRAVEPLMNERIKNREGRVAFIVMNIYNYVTMPRPVTVDERFKA
jgi:hypothetical protein